MRNVNIFADDFNFDGIRVKFGYILECAARNPCDGSVASPSLNDTIISTRTSKPIVLTFQLNSYQSRACVWARRDGGSGRRVGRGRKGTGRTHYIIFSWCSTWNGNTFDIIVIIARRHHHLSTHNAHSIEHAMPHVTEPHCLEIRREKRHGSTSFRSIERRPRETSERAAGSNFRTCETCNRFLLCEIRRVDWLPRVKKTDSHAHGERQWDTLPCTRRASDVRREFDGWCAPSLVPLFQNNFIE